MNLSVLGRRTTGLCDAPAKQGSASSCQLGSEEPLDEKLSRMWSRLIPTHAFATGSQLPLPPNGVAIKTSRV